MSFGEIADIAVSLFCAPLPFGTQYTSGYRIAGCRGWRGSKSGARRKRLFACKLFCWNSCVGEIRHKTRQANIKKLPAPMPIILSMLVRLSMMAPF